MAPHLSHAAPLDLRRDLGLEAAKVLRRIGRRALERGERAYLVGGTVRDLLLGLGAGDLDLTLVGTALELAAELVDEHGGRLVTHPRFLTATWYTAQGRRIDLAAARRERYPRPGALPVVESGDLEDDLARRDFTINAMALSLAPRRFGRLHDPHGGRADLQAGRVRPLHGGSFLDDPTRMFRAVRFAARLGFTIPGDVGRRIRAARSTAALATLSATRLRREVVYLLQEESRVAAVKLAATYGLWHGLLPNWKPGRLTARRLDRLSPFLRGPAARGAIWRPALATMLVELPPNARRQVVERLAPPRTDSRTLLRAPVEAPAFLEALRGVRAPDAALLDRAADGLESSSLLVAGALARGPVLRRAIADYLERLAHLKLAIDGRDLLAAGVAGGPQIAAALGAARRAVLAGRAVGRRAQLAAALAALDTT